MYTMKSSQYHRTEEEMSKKVSLSSEKEIYVQAGEKTKRYLRINEILFL